MVMLSFFIQSHPIPSYPIPSLTHSIPSYPILTRSLERKDGIIAFQYQYLKWLLGIGHFEVARQVQVIGMSRALWSLLGRYGFIHWLLRGCARNWVKISLPKQSHSAIGRSTNPVSRATSNWPLCGQEWYFTHIYMRPTATMRKMANHWIDHRFWKNSQPSHP